MTAESQDRARNPFLNGLLAVLALAVLNSALSMTNWWPTPFVQPDARIAPELVYLWCGLLAWFAIQRQTVSPVLVSSRFLGGLAVFYAVLVLGRYFDTTAPALFGRAINLYWDGLQIPRLLWVLMQKYPLWVVVAVIAATVSLLVGLFLVLRWSMTITVKKAVPYALQSKWALALSGFLLLSSLANLAGAQLTWPYISRPVIPTYWAQGKIFWQALLEGSGQSKLPASPAFDSNLRQLAGSDFKLFFFESYGAIVFDNAAMHQQVAPLQKALDTQALARGQSIVSAFVTSTTFGGGTDLAHMALLSGVDTRDPILHDVLLTTQRPTLVKHFKSKGYQTFGLYPALSWDWPEGDFFGFDKLVDARALNYEGPQLGYWKVPDQFALAKFRQLQPIGQGSPPRFLFFSSISSHLPFHPVPPYQPDWAKVLTSAPFDNQEVARLQASSTPWLDMQPGYVGMIKYNFEWLAGYLAMPKEREYVMVVLGDHQPTSNVTGEGASWDVPVHVIASNPALIERFLAAGFSPGMLPERKAIASLSGLTTILLNALHKDQ